MDFIKKLQNNDTVKILLLLVGVYLLMTYFYKESLENTTVEPAIQTSEPVQLPVPVETSAPVNITLEATTPVVTSTPVEPIESGSFSSSTIYDSLPSNLDQYKVFEKSSQQLTTDDLLPKYDDANEFAKENPVSKLLKEHNFLQSGYHMGINTKIQSNKIPYLDLRSAPPVAKQDIGPWSQSSYEEPAGAKRRHLEIL